MSRAILALGWTVVLTAVTLMPGKDLPEVGILNFDKVAHLGAFGLMCWLYLRWHGARRWRVALGCAAYGVLIELMQGALTVDRTADPFDALANAVGCAAALWMFSKGLLGGSKPPSTLAPDPDKRNPC